MYVYICLYSCARARTHIHTHTERERDRHTHTPVGEDRGGRVGKAEAADKLSGNRGDLGFLQ